MKRLATFLYIFIASAAIAEPTRLTSILNEGDTGYLSVTFKDQNGVATSPNTVRWWVDDEASNTNVVPIQTLVPTPGVSTYTIEIHECGQRIISNRTSENRIFTLAFTYGLSATVGVGTPTPTPGGPGPQSSNEYARYVVNNLPYLRVEGTYPDCGATQVVATATPTRTPSPTP